MRALLKLQKRSTLSMFTLGSYRLGMVLATLTSLETKGASEIFALKDASVAHAGPSRIADARDYRHRHNFEKPACDGEIASLP